MNEETRLILESLELLLMNVPSYIKYEEKRLQILNFLNPENKQSELSKEREVALEVENE